MVRAMCGVHLKDKERSTEMANSVHWYGYALRREDGHILRRSLDFDIESQGKTGKPKRTWKKQVEEESEKVCLRREDALCRSKWSVGVN